MRRRARALVVTVAVLVLAGGVAVATGTIPSSDGTIYACYKKHGGALRVIDKDANGHCVAATENPLQWSQDGGGSAIKVDYRKSPDVGANPPRTVIFQQGGLVLEAGCGITLPLPGAASFVLVAKSESDDARLRITWRTTGTAEEDGNGGGAIDTFADRDFDNGEQKDITPDLFPERAADGTLIYSRADGGQVVVDLQAITRANLTDVSQLGCILGGIGHVAL